MGLRSGTAFVEITEPIIPKYIGYLPTHTAGDSSSWRDIKTYANHLFVVREAANHGLQVFNLMQLLNVNMASMPVRFAETAHYNKFGNAHNIAINGGLHIIDIKNPSNPVAANGFVKDDYTHNCQCVVYSGPDTRYTGKEICFNYNADTLTILNVTSKSSILQLSRTGYNSSAYTHQVGSRMTVHDERDKRGTVNTRSHVFNVENLTEPIYVGFHLGTTTARDHNLYVKGILVFEAK